MALNSAATVYVATAEEESVKRTRVRAAVSTEDDNFEGDVNSKYEPARPLLGMGRIPPDFDAEKAILIVGSRAALESARLLLPRYNALAWDGNAKCYEWQNVPSVRVILWGKREDSYTGILDRIAATLAGMGKEVSIVDTEDACSDGWDLADALHEGWDMSSTVSWARMRKRNWVMPLDSKGKPIAAPFRKPRSAKELKRDGIGEGGTLMRALDLTNPLGCARLMVKDGYQALNPETMQEMATLIFQCGLWYEWRDGHYPSMEDDIMRKAMYGFIEHSKGVDKKRDERLKPTATMVNTLLDALRADRAIPSTVQAPCWMGHTPNGMKAEEVISLQNGLLHLPTRVMKPHTPMFFSHNVLPYEFDIRADCPMWEEFLLTLWPDDPEAIRCLQEIFGYLLTSDTRQQKIFMLVGPMRAGKGTIARAVTRMLGEHNVASPKLGQLLDDTGGLSTLINKQLALIPDARLDARADQQAIAETLLSISGEDRQTINIKYETPWEGRLSARFFLMTNITPRISDDSGALASRFVTLQLTRSFLGNEDQGLDDRLKTEMPGILNWAITGWDRLNQRGHFVMPESSLDAKEEMLELSAPIKAFVRDMCVLDAGKECAKDFIWQEWSRWCERQGRDHTGTRQSFIRSLRAAEPSIKSVKRDGQSEAKYLGGIHVPVSYGE